MGKSLLPLGFGFPSIKSSIYKVIPSIKEALINYNEDLCHLHFRSSFSFPSLILSEYTYFQVGQVLGLSFLVKWGWILWGPFILSTTQHDGVISHANIGSWGSCLFFFLFIFYSSTHLQLSLNLSLLFSSSLAYITDVVQRELGGAALNPDPPISEEWLCIWPGLWPGTSLWGPLSQILFVKCRW